MGSAQTAWSGLGPVCLKELLQGMVGLPLSDNPIFLLTDSPLT